MITEAELRGMSGEDFTRLAQLVTAESDRRAILDRAQQVVTATQRDYLIARDGQILTTPPDDPADAPAWVQPTGAHDAYPAGVIVAHDGRLWASTTPNNVWTPGASGWREVTTAGGDDGTPASPPEWVQPTGAHDAYALGDQVTYDGKVWKSTAAANVWVPGVYGWEVVE